MSDAIAKAASEWRKKLRRQAQAHQIERIKRRQKWNRSKWVQAMKDNDSICQFPAWEIILLEPVESLYEWQMRWVGCGGILYSGRMIAGKRDIIWSKLSTTFNDGLGKPYPPFARSSSATWSAIDRQECVQLNIRLDTATQQAINEAVTGMSDLPPDISIEDLKATRDALLVTAKKLRDQ